MSLESWKASAKRFENAERRLKKSAKTGAPPRAVRCPTSNVLCQKSETVADDDNEDRETVADIVREMLDYDGEMESWAVRIERAHRREVEAKSIIAGISILDAEFKNLRSENKRLRDALKQLAEMNSSFSKCYSPKDECDKCWKYASAENRAIGCPYRIAMDALAEAKEVR